MELDKFLGFIDLMPLRPAFKRIARDWPRRPIWASAQRLPKQSVVRQMLRALHDRRIALGTDDAREETMRFWDSIPSRFDALASETPEALAVAAVAAGTNPGSATALRLDSGIGDRRQKLPPLKWPDLPPARSSLERSLRARREHEKLCGRLLGRIVAADLGPIWRENVIGEPPRGCNCGQALSSEERKQELIGRSCGDFAALQFTKYLIYVVGQIQAIAWCISFGLLMLILVLNSYAPQAPLLVGRFLAALFVAIGVMVFWVFAGMERNAILSHIAGTQPGKLNQEFWVQLVGMGILPLIGVLSHLFPSISNFMSSWLASGVESIH